MHGFLSFAAYPAVRWRLLFRSGGMCLTMRNFARVMADSLAAGSPRVGPAYSKQANPSRPADGIQGRYAVKGMSINTRLERSQYLPW